MDKSLKYHETRSKQCQACEHKFQPWKIIKTSVTVFCSSRGIAWRPFIIDERLERRLYRTVLVEIASVFAPSRYKFIRSLSATERTIRTFSSPSISTPPLPCPPLLHFLHRLLCPRLSHRHPRIETVPCPCTILPGRISLERVEKSVFFGDGKDIGWN